MFSPVGHKKALLVLERTTDPEAKKAILDSIKNPPSSPKPIQRSPSEMLSRMKSRESFEVVNRSKAIKTEHLEEMIQDEGPMGEAARKLMEVAIRYRPERDSAVMTAFNTCSLDPIEFRKLLKNAFRLTFTDPEFDGIVRMYQKDGIVDGSEFLVSFVKLGEILTHSCLSRPNCFVLIAIQLLLKKPR
jgi:hypothetical protein